MKLWFIRTHRDPQNLIPTLQTSHIFQIPLLLLFRYPYYSGFEAMSLVYF